MFTPEMFTQVRFFFSEHNTAVKRRNMLFGGPVHAELVRLAKGLAIICLIVAALEFHAIGSRSPVLTACCAVSAEPM